MYTPDDYGFPIDWDILKEEALEQDNRQCIKCGTDTDLYVVYVNDPETVEDGYTTDNLVTLCSTHCPEGAKVPETAVGTQSNETRETTTTQTTATDTRTQTEATDRRETQATTESASGPSAVSSSSGNEHASRVQQVTDVWRRLPRTLDELTGGMSEVEAQGLPPQGYIRFGRRFPFIGWLIAYLLIGIPTLVLGSLVIGGVQAVRTTPGSGLTVAVDIISAAGAGVGAVFGNPVTMTVGFAVLYLPCLLYRDYGTAEFPDIRWVPREGPPHWIRFLIAWSLASLGLFGATIEPVFGQTIIGEVVRGVLSPSQMALMRATGLVAYVLGLGAMVRAMHYTIVDGLRSGQFCVRACLWEWLQRTTVVGVGFYFLFDTGGTSVPELGFLVGPLVVGGIFLARYVVGASDLRVRQPKARGERSWREKVLWGVESVLVRGGHGVRRVAWPVRWVVNTVRGYWWRIRYNVQRSGNQTISSEDVEVSRQDEEE